MSAVMCEYCGQPPPKSPKLEHFYDLGNLISRIDSLKEELAKERVNQTSFNECAAELAEARAQLAAIKGNAPEPQKAD